VEVEASIGGWSGSDECWVYTGFWSIAQKLMMPPSSYRKALQLAALSSTEHHEKYDNKDNDAKRDIHNILSLLMMGHPSPSADHVALRQ
jgi:hypothetical protein